MSAAAPVPSLKVPAIAELAGLGARFVTWRLQLGEGGKPTKVPYRVFGDVKAATDAPATWGTFQEACDALGSRSDRNGIGFIPRPAEDGIIAVDLDGCIDPKSGEIADWAQRAVDDLNSYTEISPSGTGLKVFARATPVPQFICKAKKVEGAPRLSDKEPQVEILGIGNRYTTLTGLHFGGTPLEIRDATDALGELADWMGRKSAGNGHDRTPDHGDRQRLDPDCLKRAAQVIPNADLPWEQWNDVGLRFWVASGGSDAGLAAFHAFSAKSDKYDAETTRRRWQGITRSPPTRYTASALIGLAQDADPDFRDPRKDLPVDADFSEMLDKLAAGAGSFLGVGTAGTGAEREAPHAFPDFSTLGAELYIGEPEPIQWLVQGVIPLGVGAVLAGMGDVGKSFKLLELCYKVACPLPSTGNLDFNVPTLGGNVVAHGSAIFATAEDSRKSVHRRLQAIDPSGRRHQFPSKLIIAPMPDLGGAKPFFVYDPRKGLGVTEEWESFCDQCRAKPDLTLVAIDPASAFAHVELDKDTTHAYFVANHCAALASETGATVILSHHLNKGAGAAPKTLPEARSRIKGNCGLVDGMRLSYVLWQPEEDDTREVCKALGVPFLPNRVALGGVVKVNDPVSREISTYVRTDAGILLDRTACLRMRAPDRQTLHDAMVEGIRDAALAGQPFTETGASGVYKLRERLPERLRTVSRERLEALVRELVEAGKIVRCMASGANHAKWLDVPGGPFTPDQGGEFRRGAV